MAPRPQQKRDRWNGQYQLQAVALHEGLRCKKKLWREAGRQQLESFQLAPWASQRRRDLLELLDQLNPTIAMRAAEQRPEAQRLMTASWGGSADGVGLRADHRESGSVSVWQADRELSGAGAVGEVERESASAGPYHETRQLTVALPVSGSGASDSA